MVAYASKEYYEAMVSKAQLHATLVREAIAVRLIAGRVVPEDLKSYADVLATVEEELSYWKKEAARNDNERSDNAVS